MGYPSPRSTRVKSLGKLVSPDRNRISAHSKLQKRIWCATGIWYFCDILNLTNAQRTAIVTTRTASAAQIKLCAVGPILAPLCKTVYSKSTEMPLTGSHRNPLKRWTCSRWYRRRWFCLALRRWSGRSGGGELGQRVRWRGRSEDRILQLEVTVSRRQVLDLFLQQLDFFSHCKHQVTLHQILSTTNTSAIRNTQFVVKL